MVMSMLKEIKELNLKLNRESRVMIERDKRQSKITLRAESYTGKKYVFS